MSDGGLVIDAMSRAEADILGGWAAAEGWNPGRADISIAYGIDPGAFLALRKDKELIGGGSIFSYEGAYGFMGLFIVRREWRGAGLGTRLWRRRLELLRQRLRPGAIIGMDGVFDMAPFYERGGFKFAYRDFRYEGVAAAQNDSALRGIDDALFPAIERFDRSFVAAPRAAFLLRWALQPGAHALALIEDGAVAGYGVARPAQVGFKIGPLFATSAKAAERILGGLLQRADGAQVQLDVPEPNTEGVALAERLGLKKVFGCARMYFGGTPDLPVQQIFGVTSFEFG